ncbi:MAG: SH3 domain-containing protein [Lachnospiraceae bacterium]|nr:SH3 domain-containing protein [Lachnospiraceae bacterium]
MLNRRKNAILICLLMVLIIALFTSGCSKNSGDHTETESETESETMSETESVTESEAELQTNVVYVSEDGTVRIVLPDSTWKVTQDLEEMRVFSSGSDAMINIVYAADESAMKNISVMESEEELEESLAGQYPEEDSFEVQSFQVRSSSTVVSYEYVVKYTYSTSMWAYSVTYAILSADGDSAYVVSGTVTEDDEDLLDSVQTAVESFTVLDTDSIFNVLPGSVENNNETESQTDADDDNEAGSDELATLSEYSSSVTLYASTSVNIRANPSTEADIAGSLLTGDAVTVTGETSGWFRVSVGSIVGYVSKAYLVSTQPETTADADEDTEEDADSQSSSDSDVIEAEAGSEISYGTSYTYYAISSANLRSQPGTSSSVVGSVAYGAAVTVTGETDNWFVVSVDGVTGYISKGLLSSTQPSTTESTGSSGSSSDDSSSTSASSSNTGAVSGTITAVTSDTLLIQGDDGVTYSINYANASMNVGSLTEGTYVTAVIDYDQTTAGGSLYATSVNG